MLPRVITGMLLACSLASQTTYAGENLWVYAKGTDTRPEGTSEFKFRDIVRLDKGSGDYQFHDIRLEYEYGINNALTVGIGAIIFDHDYSVDDPELNPMFETQGGEGGRFDKIQYAGYEVALKYNILSPYKDAFGLSLGAAYEHRDKYRLDGADIDQDSFVGTVFLQKDFLEDTLITVLNIKTEFERRKSGSVLEEEIAVDIAAGISYRVAPQWFVGLEFRHQSDYLNPQDKAEAGNSPEFDDKGFSTELDRSSFDLTDFRIGSRHQYGNYFGPTFHYAEKKWWATGGVLWQFSGGGSKFSFSRGGRNYDEHEKYHIGFQYGYEF